MCRIGIQVQYIDFLIAQWFLNVTIADGGDLYQKFGLHVDVFHWDCKHTDIECSVHCNPHNFPDFVGPDGKTWVFNSSIVEQTNVWLGGYHAILWEMGVVKFNFFLDEMIMRKNQIVKGKLEKDGMFPDAMKGLHFWFCEYVYIYPTISRGFHEAQCSY